ncbi:MAG: hypothetical protein JWM11_2343 [Planctomycetaceae bacterium]|nr:hypothetical protein [Planctomycetaceae bacterium]
MGLRIRVLDIEVLTIEGPYGVRLTFADGLNVIRAANSRGKSTCMNAILFALGLEGMLGPSHTVPLPAVMTDELLTDDNRTLEVISSRVRLEIDNAKEATIVVERNATGSSGDRQIIRVYDGPKLTHTGDFSKPTYYHVRIKRSSQDPLGFHFFLATFLDLDLPEVATGDGTSPLYLECLAPFFFVDQLSGWDAVKSRMPTYLGILEVAKRSFEFVLGLDFLLAESKRKELTSQVLRLEDAWRKKADAIARELQGTGTVIKGIPRSPAEWTSDSTCILWATDGKTWSPLIDALREAETKRQKLESRVIPRVEQISEEIVLQLQAAENELAAVENRHVVIQRELLELESESVDLDKRLDTIRDNLREYEDEQKIRVRNVANDLDLTHGICPACHRPVKDALIDQSSPSNPMSFQANIAFLRDQLKMFAEMRTETLNALSSKRTQRGSLKSRLIECSMMVQTLKRTLRQDAEAPAASTIRAQIITEQHIASLRTLDAQVPDYNASLNAIAATHAEVTRLLTELGTAKLTQSDYSKLNEFGKVFVEQLYDYEFESYRRSEIAISNDSYQPVHNNFPIGLVSASDMIRLVWAYLLGLLETARARETNHLGLLIFDEPKQHNVKGNSYEALLRRAADSVKFGQQVIIATSQFDDDATKALEGNQVRVTDFISRIISKR